MRCQHLAGSTTLHFLAPIFVNASFANSTIDKPAKVTGIEFPGRTMGTPLRSTTHYFPAWLLPSGLSPQTRDKKIHLPLNMVWNGAPSLLVAVNGLDRGSQQLCHFFLSFIELLP